MEVGFLQGIKAVIKSLVLSSPTSITIDKLNKDFRSTEGQYIPYEQLGFQSLELFLRSIPDSVVVIGNGTSACVYSVSSQKSDHVHDMILKQKKKPRCRRKITPNTVQHRQRLNNYRPQNLGRDRCVPTTPICSIRLDHSLQSKTNNVRKCGVHEMSQKHNFSSCAPALKPATSRFLHEKIEISKKTLPKCEDVSKQILKNKNESYPITEAAPPERKVPIDCLEKTLKKNLKITEDEKTITDLCNVNTSNPLKESMSGTTKNYTGYEPLPISDNQEEQYKRSDEAVPEFAANNIVFRVDFPENTVKFGKKIPAYKLPADLKADQIIGIFISEIHNPYKFWFHIYKENNELDNLMYHIERFYTAIEEDQFRIPRICISPGQVCAAEFSGEWYRAEIISQTVGYNVKVLFLDYGTVAHVRIDKIKYLCTKFANLPTQAIRGCLSHIQPRGLHWSLQSTNAFLSMASELLLYAKISQIDHEQNKIVYVVLCDSHGDEVIQINRALVEKGFAMYDKEWEKTNIEKNGERLHHRREDFPTFSMLELGEYPSFMELVNLQRQGIDYERFIDNSLYHPGKLNDLDNVPRAIRELPFPLLSTNPFRCDIAFQFLQ